MIKPGHHFSHLCQHAPRGQLWPVDQNDRQAKAARGDQLGLGPRAACVFGNDMADAVGLQQGKVLGRVKGATRQHNRAIGQRRRAGRIDQAQQIVMRAGGKACKVLLANRQEHPCGLIGQGGDGAVYIVDMGPQITFTRAPSRTLQADQGHAGAGAGLDRIAAHLGGKGVGGIDHRVNLFGAQIGYQPVNAAKAANAGRQGLGDGGFAPAESGKFGRLAELCEPIGARQQKVLVFTQFREMTEPLRRHLEACLGRPGLVLHGGTPVKQRAALVQRFQEDEGVAFMVLSLKAGGTGLNLTAANHVIHFDRWWNPAVENQATDRAFRIGQRRDVLVHKFVCQGTVEERIDALISSKQALSDGVLSGEAELKLTELSDAALLDLVRLDLQKAVSE